MELRFDLIGVLSVFGDDAGRALADLSPGDARDVRLRVAVAHADRARVERLVRRGDGALHLWPGRRRGRADVDHPAAEFGLVSRAARPRAGLLPFLE